MSPSGTTMRWTARLDPAPTGRMRRARPSTGSAGNVLRRSSGLSFQYRSPARPNGHQPEAIGGMLVAGHGHRLGDRSAPPNAVDVDNEVNGQSDGLTNAAV